MFHFVNFMTLLSCHDCNSQVSEKLVSINVSLFKTYKESPEYVNFDKKLSTQINFHKTPNLKSNPPFKRSFPNFNPIYLKSQKYLDPHLAAHFYEFRFVSLRSASLRSVCNVCLSQSVFWLVVLNSNFSKLAQEIFFNFLRGIRGS